MKKVDVTKEEFKSILLKSINVHEMITLVDKITNLVYDKNQDYGDAWQRYGIFTPLIRINDKTLRIETLSDGRVALVASEGIGDTLKDVVGYAALALLWLKTNTPKDDSVGLW